MLHCGASVLPITFRHQTISCQFIRGGKCLDRKDLLALSSLKAPCVRNAPLQWRQQTSGLRKTIRLSIWRCGYNMTERLWVCNFSEVCYVHPLSDRLHGPPSHRCTSNQSNVPFGGLIACEAALSKFSLAVTLCLLSSASSVPFYQFPPLQNTTPAILTCVRQTLFVHACVFPYPKIQGWVGYTCTLLSVHVCMCT